MSWKNPPKLGLILLFLSLPIITLSCGSVTSREGEQQGKSFGDFKLVEPFQSVKMGGGGFVTGILIHPQFSDVIYVRTDVGGLYRWNEREKKWYQLLSVKSVGQKVPLAVESFALDPRDPKIIYAALGAYTNQEPGKIIKSLDSGRTWKILDVSLPMGGNEEWRWVGERLAVDPHNSNIIYFGSRLNGLWKSENGGESWSQVNSSIIPLGETFGKENNIAGVTFVEFDANSETGGKSQVIYVGIAGLGIYRSTDGGTTWKSLGIPCQGDTTSCSSLVPQQGETLSNGELVVTTMSGKENNSNGGIWKFNGKNWEDITPQKGKNYAGLTLNLQDSNTIFAMTYPMTPNDIYRSTDGGKTWKTLQNQVNKLSWYPDWAFYTLAGDLAAFENQLWLTNGIGVWQTKNSDSDRLNWSAQVNGIEETVTFDAVSTLGGSSLITAMGDFDGFRHRDVNVVPKRNHSNGGFTTTTSIAYSGGNPNFLVRVGGSQHDFSHRYAGFSEDNGQTWQNFASITNQTHPSDLNFGNVAVSATDTNNIIWQPTNWIAPYYTKDRGRTWNKITYFEEQLGGGTHSHLWNTQQALAADSVIDGTFYFYHHVGGQLVRTQDGGETWIVANQNNLLPQGVWQGATVKSLPGVAGEVWVSLQGSGLYRSTDSGETFKKIVGIEKAEAFGFGASAPDSNHPTIFAHGQFQGQTGVFYSTDLGQSWLLVESLPTEFLNGITNLTGDMNLFGRVYVGTNGNGFIYGDVHK